MPTVTVEFTGLDNALRIARRFANLGQDPTELLHVAGSVLEASVLRRFDEERGPGGVPWPKSRRAAGTAKNKRGQISPGKTLQDTGDLRDSLRAEVRPGEVEVGFDGLKNPVKAVANQFGSHRQTVVVRHLRTVNSAFGVPLPTPKTYTVRPHGRMTNLPARPMIGIDEQDRSDIHDRWLEVLRAQFDE